MCIQPYIMSVINMHTYMQYLLTDKEEEIVRELFEEHYNRENQEDDCEI